MKIYYRILETWPQDQNIRVRYFTDKLSENDLRCVPEDVSEKPERCRSDTVLTIYDETISEEQLHDFIIGRAPLDWLRLMEKIKDPEVNTDAPMDIIEKKFVGKVHSGEVEVTTNRILDDKDIDDLLASVAVKGQ